jgi:hypothetical protein
VRAMCDDGVEVGFVSRQRQNGSRHDERSAEPAWIARRDDGGSGRRLSRWLGFASAGLAQALEVLHDCSGVRSHRHVNLRKNRECWITVVLAPPTSPNKKFSARSDAALIPLFSQYFRSQRPYC